MRRSPRPSGLGPCLCVAAAALALAHCGGEGGEVGPRVVSLAPERVAVGQTLVVRGVGFGEAQVDAFVSIRGEPCPVAGWTEEEIRVVVPEVAPGETVLVVTRGARQSPPAPLTVLP